MERSRASVTVGRSNPALGTPDNPAGRMNQMRSQMTPPPLSTVDPAFNEKIDRLDRKVDTARQAYIRENFNPGKRPGFTRITSPVPDVDDILVGPGEYNPGALPNEYTEGFNLQAQLDRNRVERGEFDPIEDADYNAMFNPLGEGAAQQKLEQDLEWLESEGDLRNLFDDPPITAMKGQQRRNEFIASKYPLLAMGLAQGNYTDREMRESINFAVAFDAAAFLNNVNMTDDQAKAFFGRMSEPQQLLVRDIAQAWQEQTVEEAEAGTLRVTDQDYADQIEQYRADVVEDLTSGPEGGFSPTKWMIGEVAERKARNDVIGQQDTGNTVITNTKYLWNWTAGWAFDVVFNQTNEFLQQAARAGALAVDSLPDIPGVTGPDMGYNVGFSNAWAMAKLGAMDPKMVAEISAKYGKRKTDIAVEIMQAQAEGDTTRLPEILIELGKQAQEGDTQAVELMEWLGVTQFPGGDGYVEAMQVFDELQFARTGNTGNILAVGLYGQPSAEDRLEQGQSLTYKAVSTIGNVAGYALDPLLLTGPVKTAMTARYGLWKILSAEARGVNRAEEFTSMWQQRAVQNAFNSLGGDLRAINQAGVSRAGELRKSVEARWKRYFRPEALDDMRLYMKELGDDAYTPEAFRDYFMENENLVQLVVGQHARRRRQLVVPHMTSATVLAKKMGMAARGFTYTPESAYQYVDELVGPGYTNSMPEEGVQALAKALAEASENGDEIARILGDFVWVDGQMVRSFTGTALKANKRIGARYGWRTKGGFLASRRWWERKRRIGQRMPMQGGPIWTADGRHAKRVGDFLEWAGMPRHFARGVELIWADKATTGAQRTQMLPGIIEQGLKARGIDQVPGGNDVLARFAGIPREDQYSPKFFDGLAEDARLTEQFKQQIRQSFESERALRFGEMGREVNQYQVGDEVFMWDKDAGQWKSMTVATVTNRGGVRLKGTGDKTISKDLLLPQSGNYPNIPPPLRLSDDEIASTLDDYVKQWDATAKRADKSATNNKTDEGRAKATQRGIDARTRAATVRLRQDYGRTYDEVWIRDGATGLRVLGETEVNVVARFNPDPAANAYLPFDLVPFNEIDDVQAFIGFISSAKANNPYGAAVTIYSADEYAGARFFVTDDGLSGFALQGNDVISVFKAPASTAEQFSISAMTLGVKEGGRRADSFATVLPTFYTRMGMYPVARVAFDDEYAPPGWDYDTFARFNDGRPDVVFYAYDESFAGIYVADDVPLVSSYERGLAVQQRAVEALAPAPAPAPVSFADELESTLARMDAEEAEIRRLNEEFQSQPQVEVPELVFPRGSAVTDETGRYYLTKANNRFYMTRLDEAGEPTDEVIGSPFRTRKEAVAGAQTDAQVRARMEAEAAPAELPEEAATFRISSDYLSDAIARDLIDIPMPEGAGSTVSVTLTRAQVQALLDDVTYYLDEAEIKLRASDKKQLQGVQKKLLKARGDIGDVEVANSEEITRRLDAAPVADEVDDAFDFAFATKELEAAQSYGNNVHAVRPVGQMEHDRFLGNEPGTDFMSREGFEVIGDIEDLPPEVLNDPDILFHGSDRSFRPGQIIISQNQRFPGAAAAPVVPDRATFATPDIDMDVRRQVGTALAKFRDSVDSGRIDPSLSVGGNHNAVVFGQTTNQMAFPNIAAMDALARRESTFAALLGNNNAVGWATDWWTLGTLAGPRFQLRSGFEDIGFYLLTGGNLGDLKTGRQMSQAIRKGSMRTKAQGRAGLVGKDRVYREPKYDADGNPVPDEADRSQKLGIVKSGTYSLVKALSKVFKGKDYDASVDVMAALITNNATPAQLKAADEAVAAGDRTKLAALIGTIWLRSRLRGHPYFQKFFGKEELSDEAVKALEYLEDSVIFNDTLRAMDEVSETAGHLFDGAPIAPVDGRIPVGHLYWVKPKEGKPGHWEKRVKTEAGWQSVRMTGGADEVRAWFNGIAQAMPLSDGPKATAALRRLPAYIKAVREGDIEAQQGIIAEIASVITRQQRLADDGVGNWPYLTQMTIGSSEGATALAQATMDNLRAWFGTKNGKLNRALYNRVRFTTEVDGQQVTAWGIRDGDEYLIDDNFLAQLVGDGFAPDQIIMNTENAQGLTQTTSISQSLWGAMGRSLARMTREPIFIGNYIDARKVLQPLEDQMRQRAIAAGMTVDEATVASKQWATEMATERAFFATLDYVDNPAIRSHLAWQVRNVARFYRALEDFFRRTQRAVRNEPSSIVKAAVAWRVIDNSGLFWQDSYGDKYFIWPGSPLVFRSLNWFMNNVFDRNGMYTDSMPAAYSSGVTKLTPSTDPNAVFPTFSGWYATIAAMPIVIAAEGLFGIDLRDELFGEYADREANPLIAAVPPHALRAAQLAMEVDDYFASDPEQIRDSLDRLGTGIDGAKYSATMSTIQAAAAAGWWDESKSWEEQGIDRDDLLRRIDRTSIWVMALKTALSPVIPAALKMETLSGSDFARSLGYTDLRQEFIALLKATGDKDQAVVLWMQMHPDGKSPYVATVSKGAPTENSGSWLSFQETHEFIQEHQEIADENPLGLSFFAPQKGTTTLRGLETLRVNDLIAQGTPLTYLERVLTAEYKLVRDVNRAAYDRDYLNELVKPEVWQATNRALKEQ